MLFYLGKDLGDLVKVTLSKCGQQIYAFHFTSSFYNSAVEATLAIMLLNQCESVFVFFISSCTPLNVPFSRLRILKSTIIGKRWSWCCTDPS